MIRTWLRTKTGASTLTKATTSIDFWAWATAIAALSSQPSKNSIRIRTPRADVFEIRQEATILPQRLSNANGMILVERRHGLTVCRTTGIRNSPIGGTWANFDHIR